jgi:hypothetical protein
MMVAPIEAEISVRKKAEHRHLGNLCALCTDERAGDADQDVGEDAVVGLGHALGDPAGDRTDQGEALRCEPVLRMPAEVADLRMDWNVVTVIAWSAANRSRDVGKPRQPSQRQREDRRLLQSRARR